MSVLVGSLEAFALPDVFRLVSQNSQTGVLKVHRESGDGSVFFREGSVYYAESSLEHDFLGQKVLGAKLLSKTQLMRLLDEQTKRGDVQLGDLLVEKGILNQDLLQAFLKDQVHEAVFGLLQWDVGRFSFDAGEVAAQDIGLSVSVENLLMESARRLEEWEVIQRKIPSLDVALRMSPSPPADTVEINIKPEEWSLLVLADGVRTVRDIAAATGHSEFDASKIIYGLLTAGLLQVMTEGVVPTDEEPSRLAPRDLDDLVLDRSSPPVSDALVDVSADAAAGKVVLPEPVSVKVSADAIQAGDIRAGQNGTGHTDAEMNEAQPAASAKPAATQPATKGQGEAPISKETLLRLIAGVRSL